MNKRPQPASGKTVSENASSTGASASGAQGNTASDGTDSKEARKKKSMETWGHEKKLKFTYKEQKEYETIEADIEKLENRLSEIDDEMVKNATNFGKLNELTKEKEDLEGQLMEKMVSRGSGAENCKFDIVQVIHFFLGFNRLNKLCGMPNPNMIPSTMAPATSKVSIPFEEESALSFVKR